MNAPHRLCSHASRSPPGDAETARLAGLGATEVARWQECRVLRAPGGHLLCVLPVETDDFEAGANVWP